MRFGLSSGPSVTPIGLFSVAMEATGVEGCPANGGLMHIGADGTKNG